MTKKTFVFDVDVNNALLKINNGSSPFTEAKHKEVVDVPITKRNITNITIEQALTIIIQQMALNGLRTRTIKDYEYQFKRFTETVNIQFLHEITVDKIYEYLSSMDKVKDITKLNRLKTISAILTRCYDNGWYKSKFWVKIKIKVDKIVKPAADVNELNILLTLIDKNTYAGFRDACAILILYKTGIRIRTLGLLEEKHIDFNTKTLCLSGDIMKSHRSLKIPLDDEMIELLQQLIEANNKIKKYFNKKNQFIFLTKWGDSIEDTVSTANLIAKNLWKYSKKYGLKITAHSIRRLYARTLLSKGAPINLVSAALGHSDLGTTSRYLYLNELEVEQNLRDYL